MDYQFSFSFVGEEYHSHCLRVIKLMRTTTLVKAEEINVGQ